MIDNGLYVDKPVLRRSAITSFQLFNNVVQLVAPASVKRKRITFANQGLGVLILFQQPVFDFNRFFTVGATVSPFFFDFNDYGTMIQANWFASASTLSTNISVIDTVED